MKKNTIFVILLIIIAIGGVTSLVLLNTNSIDNSNTNKSLSNNSTNISQNINNNSHNNNHNSRGNIIVTQEGPSSASYNSEVTIKWTVTNKGSYPITEVKGTSQSLNYDFGTIAPGESKSTNLKLFIPDPSYIDGNGSDPVAEDYYIGGFSLNYKLNGQSYQINSNSITIAIQ